MDNDKNIKNLAELFLNEMEEDLMQLVQNNTNYAIKPVISSKAWYVLIRDNQEIDIQTFAEKPKDIKQSLWNKILDIVGNMEIECSKINSIINKWIIQEDIKEAREKEFFVNTK